METILFIRTYSNNRPAYPERLAGAIAAARERNWRVQMVDKPAHGQIAKLLDLWHPRGAICESTAGADSFPSRMFGGIPVVYLEEHRENLAGMAGRIGCVGHDPVATAKTAAVELLSGDCAAYAYIPNFSPVQWCRSREDAFKELLAVNGIEPLCFRFDSKTENTHRWYRELRVFLKRLPKPCGVFAVNDYVGESVLSVCADAGISVPEDISVVSVDNRPLICENTSPTLSSVALDFSGAGRMSVELIEELSRMRKDALLVRAYGILGLVRRTSSRRLRRNFPGLQQTLDTIRTRACEGLGAEEALAGMKCSRRLAEMRFRLATGQSALEAIHARRLERACELLAGTDSSIEAVANMCGYASAVFLQKLFRRRFGVTPSGWRAQRRIRGGTI